MRFVNEQPPEVEQLAQYYREICDQLSNSQKACTKQEVTFAAQSTLQLTSRSIYRIKEGIVLCARAGLALLYFEEGDMLFPEAREREIPFELRTDFATKVEEFTYDQFLENIKGDAQRVELWSRMLIAKSNLFFLTFGLQAKGELNAQPEIRSYADGESIVRQGDSATEVFTLMEGAAEVFVDDVKVGEVQRDEIFGVLAALTGTPRIASVVAKDRALVLALPKGKFMDLMISRPSTVLKMVEDMARTMVSLNQQVVGYARGRY